MFFFLSKKGWSAGINLFFPPNSEPAPKSIELITGLKIIFTPNPTHSDA